MRKYQNIVINILSDLLKQWQIIIVSVVIGICIYDFYKIKSFAPLYISEITYEVDMNENRNYSGDEIKEITDTLQYIYSSNVFKNYIKNSFGLSQLNGQYTVSSYGASNILVVRASSPSSKTAYLMMRGLQEQSNSFMDLVIGNSNLKQISNPKMPENSSTVLNHKSNMLFGGFISMIGIVGILASLSYLKNTIKYKEEIETKLNLSILGTLPFEIRNSFRKNKRSIMINKLDTSFEYIESIRHIQNNIEKSSHKVIMITSSLESEGKSTISSNVAIALAKNNKKVLLIDGDMRKPSQMAILERNNIQYGLEDVLFENVKYRDALVSYKEFNLDVLFGLKNFDVKSDNFPIEKLKGLLESVKDYYDYIIIDSAPSAYLSDSRKIASIVDGIILIIKQNYAPTALILETIEKLIAKPNSFMGCILNCTLSTTLSSYGYYGYRYGYNHYYKKKRR